MNQADHSSVPIRPRVTGAVADRHKKLITKKKCCVPSCKNTSDTSEDLIFFLVTRCAFRKDVFDAIEAGTGVRPKLTMTGSSVHVCQAHYKLEEDVKFWDKSKPYGGLLRFQLKPGVVPHVFHGLGDPGYTQDTTASTSHTSENTEYASDNLATVTSGEKRKLPMEYTDSEEGVYCLDDDQESRDAASINLVNFDVASTSTASKRPRSSQNQEICATDHLVIINKKHKCEVCMPHAEKYKDKLHTSVFPCSRCNFVLSSHVTLEKHLTKRHKCSKSSIEVQAYCNTLRQKPATRHSCVLCKNLYFTELEHLQGHVNIDHRLCNVCGTKLKLKVEEHIVQHKDAFKSIFQCTACYFESPFKQKVLDHIAKNHGDGIYFVMESNGRLGFDCPYCHYSTSCNRVLEVHMKHHKGETCIICECKYIPSAKHIACNASKICRKCQPNVQWTNRNIKSVSEIKQEACENAALLCQVQMKEDANVSELDLENGKKNINGDANVSKPALENVDESSDLNSANIKNSAHFSQVYIKEEIVDDEYELENGTKNINNDANVSEVNPENVDESSDLNCGNTKNPAHFSQVYVKEEIVDDEYELGNVTKNPTNMTDSAHFNQVYIKEEVQDDEFEQEGTKNTEELPNFECVKIKTEPQEMSTDDEEQQLVDQDTEWIFGPLDPPNQDELCKLCNIYHETPNLCYISTVIKDAKLLKSVQSKDADIKRNIQVLEILGKFLVKKVRERRLSRFIINQFKEAIALAVRVSRPVDKQEQCFLCGLYLSSILELYDHLMVSHKNRELIPELKLFLKPFKKRIEIYRCLVCNIGMKCVTDLFYHVSKLHNYCRLCGNSCLDHITSHEMEMIKHPFYCHICDLPMRVDLDTFQQHFKVHSPIIKPQSNKFNCPYCQFCSNSVHSLSFHLTYHKSQSCVVCSVKFVTETKYVGRDNWCYRCNDFETVRGWKYEDHVVGNIANVVLIRDANIHCFEGAAKLKV